MSRFATHIYARIPYELGGGKPLRVVFLLRPDREASPLIEDGATGKSIPYNLLLATDRTFVVLPQDQKVKSIEFERSSVIGLKVLREQD